MHFFVILRALYVFVVVVAVLLGCGCEPVMGGRMTDEAVSF